MPSKAEPQHQDYLGRELAVGDCVVFSVRNLFQLGRIVKFGQKQIRIVGYDYARRNWRTGEAKGDLKYPNQCLKVDSEEVTFYLLKKGSSNA